MNRWRKFILAAAVLLLVSGRALPQGMVVEDVERALELAYEIYEQGMQFKQELEQFKNELQQWVQRQEQWKGEREYSLGRFNLFDKIRQLQDGFLNGMKLVRRRVDKDFDWEGVVLKEIQEILGGPLFKGTSTGDPYQGLFTAGTSFTQVFPDVGYKDHILKSSEYKANEVFRKYADALLQEEDRMLADMEIRRSLLAQVSRFQVASEEKLQKFQKQLTGLSQMTDSATYLDGKYSNVSEMLAWNMELNLELSRQLLQQIMVKKTMVESQMLRMVRRLYEEKLETIKGDDTQPGTGDAEVAKALFKENQ